MSMFLRIRNYKGTDGERVELRPAREVQAFGGRKWLYRFPEDPRWRIAKDKFTALLEAAWEKGKSGAAMAWQPFVKERKVPQNSRPSHYSAWQSGTDSQPKEKS